MKQDWTAITMLIALLAFVVVGVGLSLSVRCESDEIMVRGMFMPACVKGHR